MKKISPKTGLLVGGNVFAAILIVILGVILFSENKLSLINLPPGVSSDVSAVVAALQATPTAALPTPVPTTLAPTPTPPPTAIATAEPTTIATVEPTVEPTPTPIPQPKIGAIVPTRLRIPSLGIDTQVEQVGKTKDGAMDVPNSFWTVGWYKLGAKPGEIGNAVIDGHLDNPKGPSIFWDLKKLVPGSRIFVSDNKGQELVFEVYDNADYPFDSAPLEKIFGTASNVQLNLITCGGVFDQKSHNYDRRLVVYARYLPNP